MTPKRHKFSARVFLGAGIYGVVALLPQYFLEEKLARDFPSPLNHPEHFYGFIGVALAWQFVFLIIAGDVQRYRPLMLPATLEKLSFGVAALVLYGKIESPRSWLALASSTCHSRCFSCWRFVFPGA
jgi:hypothetical protein